MLINTEKWHNKISLSGNVQKPSKFGRAQEPFFSEVFGRNDDVLMLPNASIGSIKI